MSVILNGECLAVGEPMAMSTVPPMPIPSLCLTTTGWEEGRVEHMEDELNTYAKNSRKLKTAGCGEEHHKSAERGGWKSYGRIAAARGSAKGVGEGNTSTGSARNARVRNGKGQGGRFAKDLVSARRYLPIQRDVMDQNYYASPEEVKQKLILCHLERQNVSETIIDIDADGYAIMTILLLDGSEYQKECV
ncbi:unnamed protein product [Cylicocyclus nassatus]|uniref:Uncharacterized protein n=1 Tax=Cylicocyclus nassatus TaxID=53992 RepID=A0AA36M578_CYLNA|nr:unnamed protein product [Cylicocyclus nassatus]